jgi:hypothetical protein
MKGVPLRDWASNSYDPNTGRAASSLRGDGVSTTIEGERISPSRQMPRRDNATGGGATLAEQDPARCQNPTPVKSRPLG